MKENIEETLPKHVKVGKSAGYDRDGIVSADLLSAALLNLNDDPGCGLVAVSQDFPGGMGEVQSQRFRMAAARSSKLPRA